MLHQETLLKRCFQRFAVKLRKKSLLIPRTYQLPSLFTKVKYSSGSMSEPKNISNMLRIHESPPHLICQQKYLLHNKIMHQIIWDQILLHKIFKTFQCLETPKIRSAFPPKPEITPIIERGAALSMSYLHQISLIMGYISCTKYFSNYRSPKYVEPKNDAGVGNISHQNEVV